MLKRCGVTDEGDTAQWDDLVRQLLGPRMPDDPVSRRRYHALQIAAAALRLAGEPSLAAQVLPT